MLLLFFQGCGGDRNIERPQQPDIIPVTRTVELSETYIFESKIDLNSDRIIISIGFNEFFNTGEIHGVSGYYYVDFKTRQVIDPLSKEIIGIVLCKEGFEKFSKCKDFDIKVTRNPLKISRACTGENMCIQPSRSISLRLKKYLNYEVYASFDDSEEVKVADVEKWGMELSSILPKDRKTLKFNQKILIPMNGKLKFRNALREEFQQMMPHLSRFARSHRLGIFSLLGSTDNLKDIYYHSFKSELSLLHENEPIVEQPSTEGDGDESNESHNEDTEIKLEFLYSTPQQTKESKGYYLIKVKS